MSDAFTPQVRALLDRLEPPALSADFADRLVAKAEAAPAQPPLPRLRKPGPRRRFVLPVALVGFLGAAAAAAMVPAEAWRTIPVIGEIVELMSPARNDPGRIIAQTEPAPVTPEISEPAAPEAVAQAEPVDRPTIVGEAEPPPAEVRADPAPPREEAVPVIAQPEPVERARDALSPPAREIPQPQRPTLADTREAAPPLVERPVERTPERIRPADTAETRQQIRERTTTTRQITRERIERQQRRATSRTN